MTSFLRRVASCRRLPATEAEEEHPLLTIHVSQPVRSLSGSLSAPELSCRKQHQQKQQLQDPGSPASTAPSSRASSPRRMRAAAATGLRCSHPQQLALAFVAGGLLTYLCVGLVGRAGARLGFLGQNALPAELAAPLCERGGGPLPATWGLSPLALGNQTGDTAAAPDRLIVAVRHAEDPAWLEEYLNWKVHRFYHASIHTFDCQDVLTEDTAWLDVYLSEVPHVVYQVDAPSATLGAQHRTLANKGNEAMAYLQFILDYWERLPASIAFIHGHRHAWHMTDHVPLLRRLRWGEVPYANLRYRNGPHDRLRWKCHDHTDDERFQKFDCNWVGNWIRPGKLKPRRARAITPMNKDEWIDSVELAEVWEQTFQEELGPMPLVIHGPCCAEFLVSRGRIRARPREFYESLRDWILETELDRYRSGRVFEYMWPLIFGEPPVTEPVEECTLLHCTEAERALADAPTQAPQRGYITSSNTREDADMKKKEKRLQRLA